MNTSRARITGGVYLLYFLTAILAQTLAKRGMIASGNAVNLIAYALYAALTLLFYHMFKPVSRSVSLMAAALSFAGCAIGALDALHFAPLNINPLWFFGFYCLLIGYLVIGSTFLPRILGWLMVAAGIGWLAFLSPPLAKVLSVYIEVLGILAEASLMFWLLAKGVHVQRWKQQAASRGGEVNPASPGQ